MAKTKKTSQTTQQPTAPTPSNSGVHPLVKYFLLPTALAAFAWNAWPLLQDKWDTLLICHNGGPYEPAARLASLETLLARGKAYGAHSVVGTSSAGPAIVVMDNFLAEEEVQRLVELSSVEGFSAAKTGQTTMRSSIRTSEVSFCNSSECRSDPLQLAIRKRASELTGLPEANQEEMQFVRYEQGQTYNCHHDQQTPLDAPQGARVWTLLMYLSEPGAGGATRFSDLDLAIEPARGRAVLFPNVWTPPPQPRAPRAEPLPELYTHHEAEAVLAPPHKLAANLWIHARAYTAEQGKYCAGGHDPDATPHAEQWRVARRQRGLDDTLPPSMRNATLQAARMAAMREQGTDTSPLSQAFFFVSIGIFVARLAGFF
jgi:prolyl 4-hydroxylase